MVRINLLQRRMVREQNFNVEAKGCLIVAMPCLDKDCNCSVRKRGQCNDGVDASFSKEGACGKKREVVSA